MGAKRTVIIILIADALLLALFGTAFLRFRHFAGMLESQQAAERWQGESGVRFAQVSAFRPVEEEMTLNDVAAFRQKLETALVNASLDLDDEGIDMWVDAFSARTKTTMQGNRGSVDAETVAVGGQYFFFHPLKLISGTWLSESDLSRDGVVVTRELAWALFGAVDVTGMTVYVGNTPRLVTGVVDVEEDAADRAAEAPAARAYVHLDSLYPVTEKVITGYELVVVDPISGFAKKTASENLPSGGEVLENSARYKIENIWKLISRFGRRSMNTAGVVYPYWENAARYTEDMAALQLLFMLLTGVVPFLSVITAFVLGFVYLRRQGRRVIREHRMI